VHADDPEEEPAHGLPSRPERAELPPEDLAAPADDVHVAADGEISVCVVVADGGASGRGRMTLLRLAWSPSDPLAVELRLSAQPDHPALPRGSWTVLRDFLHYGLEEPTGDGSVRIRPDEARDVVWLELHRHGRPASVSLPRLTVRAFLASTEEAVPSGEERSDEAVDALLARLLAED
jgi:hypothetical protein